MSPTKRTNTLAIISFTSGLITLLSAVIIIIIYNLMQLTDSILFFTDGILMPVRNISVVVALVTGILAHYQIKKSGHVEKGKWLAWAGIILGAGWLLFGICTGMVFLISALSQLL